MQLYLMAQFMMKMEKLIVINKKNITYILLPFFLNTSVNAASESDLEQYNKYHTCQNCDLSGTHLEGKKNSILDGSILISSSLSGNFISSSLVGSILTQVNAIYLKAMVSNFSQAKSSYAKFHKASFSGTNFQDADLSRVNFKSANLSSVDFTNASLKGANLDFSILIGAQLTEEQLKSAKSYYCAILPDGTLAQPQYQSHNCINRH